jgi:hypothetical protein
MQTPYTESRGNTYRLSDIMNCPLEGDQEQVLGSEVAISVPGQNNGIAPESLSVSGFWGSYKWCPIYGECMIEMKKINLNAE